MHEIKARKTRAPRSRRAATIKTFERQSSPPDHLPPEVSVPATNLLHCDFLRIDAAHHRGEFVAAFADWVMAAHEFISQTCYPSLAHHETGRHLHQVLVELHERGKLAPALMAAVRPDPSDSWDAWQAKAFLSAAIDAQKTLGIPLSGTDGTLDACSKIWRAVPSAARLGKKNAMLKWREIFRKKTRIDGPVDGQHFALYDSLFAHLEAASTRSAAYHGPTVEELYQLYVDEAEKRCARLMISTP